jgi:hypothetical protein
MELLTCLATIATKLRLSSDQVLILHCFNRGFLGKVGTRATYSILGDLVERFGLDDRVDAPTYGAQLVKKGILTPAEGYLFAEGYLLNAERTQSAEQLAGDGAVQQAVAFDGKD